MRAAVLQTGGSRRGATLPLVLHQQNQVTKASPSTLGDKGTLLLWESVSALLFAKPRSCSQLFSQSDSELRQHAARQ